MNVSNGYQTVTSEAHKDRFLLSCAIISKYCKLFLVELINYIIDTQ